MHERRKVAWRDFDGWSLTWLLLVKISTSLWLADFFPGVGEPTTYWRVGCLFSLCCFYVLKYCSENSWVGCNECFQRPSFERGFFPALGGHHPFSCAVQVSLVVPTHKGPLCEPVSKCASTELKCHAILVQACWNPRVCLHKCWWVLPKAQHGVRS